MLHVVDRRRAGGRRPGAVRRALVSAWQRAATGGCAALRPRWWASRAAQLTVEEAAGAAGRDVSGDAGGGARAPHRGRHTEERDMVEAIVRRTRRDPVAGAHQALRQVHRGGRHRSGGAARRALRPARAERRGEDHHDPDDRRHSPAHQRHRARWAASTSRRGRSRPRPGSATSPTGRSCTTSSPAASSSVSPRRSTASGSGGRAADRRAAGGLRADALEGRAAPRPTATACARS